MEKKVVKNSKTVKIDNEKVCQDQTVKNLDDNANYQKTSNVDNQVCQDCDVKFANVKGIRESKNSLLKNHKLDENLLSTNDKVDGIFLSTNNEIDGNFLPTNDEVVGNFLSTNNEIDGNFLSTNDEESKDNLTVNDEESKETSSVTKTAVKSRKTFAAATVAKIAVLTAISYILYMFVKFPIAVLFPSFLEIQISDLPALLGGFSMGPIAGCAIVVIKCLLKMPFTHTGTVGEIGDIIIGIAFILPASLIYRRHKNKKGAFIGLIFGTISCTIFAVIANRFLLIPFYINIFPNGWDDLINMVNGLYSGITIDTFYGYYLGFGIVPFNILRCALTGVLTFLVYKPLSKALHWEGKK